MTIRRAITFGLCLLLASRASTGQDLKQERRRPPSAATAQPNARVVRTAGDVPHTLSTAAALGRIGGTALVRTESVGWPTDVDLYRFEVAAGQSVGFDIDTTTNGPPGLGSYLRVFNAQGDELAANNDRVAPGDPPPGPDTGGNGFDSYIEHTFAAAGTYYVGVSNWQHRRYNADSGSTALGNDTRWLTGAYSLTVTSGSRDLSVVDAQWMDLSVTKSAPAAPIRVRVGSTWFTGSAMIRFYQSSDATLDRGTDLELHSKTIQVTGQASQPLNLSLSSPPKSATPVNYILVAIDAGSSVVESNTTNNVFALKIIEPGALSFELQSAAPLAKSRLDRVELWLRKHRSVIRREAGRREVSAAAIAGVIAWEALFNVKSGEGPASHGPGKVHSFEISGQSLAVSVEEMGYVANLTWLDRKAKLRTVPGAVDYIGAILDAFSDIAESEGSQANIRGNAGVLATLYHGISPKGTPIRLENARAYFRDKVAAGDTYSPSPFPELGGWVHANILFLQRGLGF